MSVSSREQVRVEIETETETQPLMTSDERAFSIALIGPFSGSAIRGPVERRKPLELNPDTLELLLKRLQPKAETPGGSFQITSLEDFHADHLYTHLPVFGRLRDLRQRLSDPSTAAAAIREIVGEPEPAEETNPLPPPPGNLLDAIVGGGMPASAAPAPAQPSDPLQKFINEAVRPFLVERPDARTPDLLRQMDEAASGILRSILHAPSFQSLESVWQTAFQLVRRLDTGVDLKLWLIDITQEEFAADPLSVSQVLTENGPWAVIASFFSFGSEDIELMTEAGRIARRCGTSWLAEAHVSLLNPTPDWAAFRQDSEAAWLGLAMPRILLRMPYGKGGISCDELPFEEFTGKPGHPDLLWGNPAPFCAMLLGQAFEQRGWSMHPGAVREIGGLPVYVYKDDSGDLMSVPCAETDLTEESAEALMDHGIMPIAWTRNSDFVRVLRFESVAHPPAALPGPWHHSI